MAGSSLVNDVITVAVGTVGKAHGLKGEVSLILRTDVPEDRLFDGAELNLDAAKATAPAALGSLEVLTVKSTRVQQGRWYVKFEEVTDRNLAEALRGADVTVDLDRDEEFELDPDAWYPDELKGLSVETEDGTVLGKVIGLEHYPAQDMLIVRGVDGTRVMLPFVEELVPEVDLEAGKVIANPPGGLFDPENASSERDGQQG